jgi:hypothetical protein
MYEMDGRAVPFFWCLIPRCFIKAHGPMYYSFRHDQLNNMELFAVFLSSWS